MERKRNRFMERLREQLREDERDRAVDRADPDQAREEFWGRHHDLERAYRRMAIEGDEPTPRETTQGILMDMIDEGWAVDDDLLADAAHMDWTVDQFMLRQYRDERELERPVHPRWEVVSGELERATEQREAVEDAFAREQADEWEIGD